VNPIHLILIQSLGADTITIPHADRTKAVIGMAKILTGAGWPETEAAKAAESGRQVLTSDDGDGETVEIRELKIIP
jgi:phage-related tail fiber protein